MSKIQQLNTNGLDIDKTSRHYHDIYNEETTNHPLFPLHQFVLSEHLMFCALFSRGPAKPTLRRYTLFTHTLYPGCLCNISRNTVIFHPSLRHGFNVYSQAYCGLRTLTDDSIAAFFDVLCNYLHWWVVRLLHLPTLHVDFLSHWHKYTSSSTHALRF